MGLYFTLKFVTKLRYHLWLDALHARALAKQTKNDWNRGTYIRWTITTAWTCFEMCCKDAFEIARFRRGLKNALDQAYASNSLPRINWEEGVWAEVLKVLGYRNKYVHRVSSQRELWPDILIAEEAINILRNAIKQVYIDTGKEFPSWIDDDTNMGWVNDGDR